MCKRRPTKRANGNKQPGSLRRKLWELDGRFHCSVIGTCLSLDDLRKIVTRCDITLKGDCSDYDLHGAFVNMAHTSCTATRQAQKLLDRKHAAEIRQFGKVRDESALAQLWDKKFSTGQVAGGYWALITNPYATDALTSRAHGEVHMLSHQVGASNRVDLKRMSVLEHRCVELETQLSATRARSTRQLHERDTALRKLNARLIEAIDAERQLQFATHRIRNLEGGKELRHLRKRVQELTNKYQMTENAEALTAEQRDDLIRQLADSQKTNQKLQAALNTRTDELRRLQQARQTKGEFVPCPADLNSPPDINLCGRCVLFVGGRTGQCSHFRRLVEHHNGRFIHHDGGREDGRQRLATILPQADIVLCPVDCISHDAVNRIKRFCSQHAKRLVLMPRTSLSAFTNSLKEVAV